MVQGPPRPPGQPGQDGRDGQDGQVLQLPRGMINVLGVAPTPLDTTGLENSFESLGRTMVEEITTETMLQSENMEPIKPNCNISLEKAFITSPTDVDTHRKVKLQDAEVLDKYKKEFEELCEEYKDIFSKDSSDIGKIPLITMEIETGDSPLVCQRPYNLPLKHIDWVQKELDTL